MDESAPAGREADCSKAGTRRSQWRCRVRGRHLQGRHHHDLVRRSVARPPPQGQVPPHGGQQARQLARFRKPQGAPPHLVAAENFLAKGGFGAAYKCGPDQEHPHVCAVKLVKYVVHELDGSLVTVERGLQHFDLAYQEGQLLHALRDEPNVANLHDMAHHNGCVYLRMELGTNGTLHGKRLQYEAWVYMSASLLSQYLRFGRRGVLHRDLKPANVILCDLIAKFMDFGIAKRIQPVPLEARGAWEMEVLNDGQWGTLDYQAPEIKAGLPYTAAADAYSMGKLLQDIRGRFTPAQDERADALIKALCHKDPNQRACTFWPVVKILYDLQTDTDWKLDIEEFMDGVFQPPVQSMKASLGLP